MDYADAFEKYIRVKKVDMGPVYTWVKKVDIVAVLKYVFIEERGEERGSRFLPELYKAHT